MVVADYTPRMKQESTRHNAVILFTYVLFLPIAVIGFPIYLLYAIGTNHNGWRDLLSNSPLAIVPTIKLSGWKSAVIVFIVAIVIVGGLGVLGLGGGGNGNGDPTGGNGDDPNNITGTEDFEIHAINVGQADATLLIAPSGETMLIDSGDWTDDGEIVLEYLENHGIERIDHLVSTHAHADHIGGHAAIIEQYETEKEGIGQIWDSGVTHTSQTYDDYLDAVEEHNVTLFETQEGDEIPIDGIQATVLNPPADPEYPDDLHYNSVTVLVEHGEVGFIATGDAEEDAEQRLADEYGEDLESDIYHAGHHGSSTSSTVEFLSAVDPETSIISSAYDSQFGHPDEKVLNRFADHNIAAAWTGIHGSMVFTSDGEDYNVTAQADRTTNPTQLRDEPEITADPAAPTEYELSLDLSDEVDDPKEDDPEEDDPEEDDPDEDDSNLEIYPSTAGATAEHTWEYDEIEFSGSVDEIMVEYPDGTSFDGLTDTNVTVTMTRSLAEGPDTSEIDVNQGEYAGSSAMFELSGIFNTEITDYLEVHIDDVENPNSGDHTATITLIGDDDELSIDEAFTIEQ